MSEKKRSHFVRRHLKCGFKVQPAYLIQQSIVLFGHLQLIQALQMMIISCECIFILGYTVIMVTL